MKKIRKLTIKKNVVSELTNPELRNLQGGGPGSTGLPISCVLCTQGCICETIVNPQTKYDAYCNPPTPSAACTIAEASCNYDCGSVIYECNVTYTCYNCDPYNP